MDLLFRFGLLIFGRKIVICFVCFDAIVGLILTPFLNNSSHQAEKDAVKEKIIRCTA